MNEIPELVGILKGLLLIVMLVGGVAVFRELVPMARGRVMKEPVAPTTTTDGSEEA